MSNVTPIRVLIVDDHAVVRSGLSTFLLAFDDMELVGEASNGVEAVKLCKKIEPDIVLMDLVMPKMDGAEATRKIRQCNPNIQVIALTSFKENELMYDVLDAGAIGYLLKNVSIDELANAIRAAYAGQSTLVPEATKALLHAATNPDTMPVEFDLTDRERDVLRLMAKGLNNPQIAEQLVVSRSTIRFHVSNILSKLSVTSRTEAVAVAIQHNLINRQIRKTSI